MALGKEQVEHIAQLARLGLTEKEKRKFSLELSSILDYVEKLSKVDTDKIEPTAQVMGLENVMVEDEVKDCNIPREELLKNAPDKKDGFIRVKQVLD